VVDFRYHIVSIVAVFLALAVGIVLGTYTINNQVLSNIKHQVSGLRHDNDRLRGRIATLQGQDGHDRAFVAAVDPLIVAGRLSKQRVALVLAPGASSGMAGDIKQMVLSAGATVTSTVKIGKAWTDPTQLPLLDDLAARLVEPGITLPTGSTYERIALVLAQALLRHPTQIPTSSAPPATSADTTALAGLTTAQLVSVTPSHPTPATLAVLVAPDAPSQPTKDDVAAANGLAALAHELDVAGGGTVVAGSIGADQPAGVIAAVRADSTIKRAVSTVDDADTETGRIRLVLALAAELDDASGQYGVGPGANAPAPSPAPLPTSTP
jgi:hypothetical protein